MKWFGNTKAPVKSLRIESTDEHGNPVAYDMSIQSGDTIRLNVTFIVDIDNTFIKHTKVVIINVE